MDAARQTEELASALLARARALADEYIARGRRGRDHIVNEANERLRLREEREVLLAKAAAERRYRQQVQAAEIKLQRELDQFRWGVVQTVLAGLGRRLQELSEDRRTYRPLLQRYLAQAAEVIESSDLVAEFNARDTQWLRNDWAAFVAEAHVSKQIVLAEEPCQCTGGVLVRTVDNRIRVNNTFEGRRERFAAELFEVVLEHLFQDVAQMESVAHG